MASAETGKKSTSASFVGPVGTETVGTAGAGAGAGEGAGAGLDMVQCSICLAGCGPPPVQPREKKKSVRDSFRFILSLEYVCPPSRAGGGDLEGPLVQPGGGDLF